MNEIFDVAPTLLRCLNTTMPFTTLLLRGILSLLAIALVSGCASRVEPVWKPGPNEARLVELMAERLVLAQEVARTKYREGLPIRDGKRESASMKALVAKGRSMGLSSYTTSRFFKAQFAASRLYQTELISYWRAGGRVPPGPHLSLSNAIRPRLDAINDELLRLLAFSKGTARGEELATRAELYFEALRIPRVPALKSIAPIR